MTKPYRSLPESERAYYTGERLICPTRGDWTSFQLVDELGSGEPYAGLDYLATDMVGATYRGKLDANGYAKVTNHYRGPLVVTADKPLGVIRPTRGIRRAHNHEAVMRHRQGAAAPPEIIPKPSRSAHSRAARRAGLALLAALPLAGCATPETFTLQADLPAHFKFTGDAYYVPAPSETCSVPAYIDGRKPDRKFFKSDYVETAHRVEFQVPLTDTVKGCRLVLRSMLVDVGGKWGERKWGPDWYDIAADSASLSFRDTLPTNYAGMPASGVRQIDGQCHWMFRTVGPQRSIRKLLKCQSLEDGQLQKWKPGGVLQRDQLPGKTVRLVIGLSAEEEPYYDGYWLKTPAGWKPCEGGWNRAMEELCTEPPRFKDFKLPDGRTCTVYPNCTEQESRHD